jgi:leucyl aminopeptidase
MCMTTVEISLAPAGSTGEELLAVPFCEGPAGPEPGPGAAQAGQAAGADLADLAGLVARQGFRGQAGEVAVFLVPGPGPDGRGPARIAAIGIGPAADACPAAIRDAAQCLAGLAAGSSGVATTLALAGPDRAQSLRAAAEGFLLGAYRVPRAGSRPVGGAQPAPPARLTLLAGDPGQSVPPGWRAALHRGVTSGQTANWVRDLVHAPAGEATPEMLAETIAAQAARHGAAARIWAAGELAAAGFGGITGVGQGSRNAPRMVELSWAGDGGPGAGGPGAGGPGAGGPGAAGSAARGRSRLVALAGKGITFDSGGINLKRDPDEIAWMRSDMAGGAAAAAAVIAAARLGLPVPAVAVVPLAENMPGGGALRPGDVLTHRGGRTSQVADTDSEGRLVIADAVAYLAERSPAALIDVATLTDAAGLGPALWAAMGTDRPLLDEVLRAGESAGEPGWPLPLPGGYRELLACPAADMRNTPSRGPDSAVMAAVFLREFVGEAAWVHIDNGSTAWLEHDHGPWPEGATGSPVRALIRFLEARAAP